jgi:hypothetical protein
MEGRGYARRGKKRDSDREKKEGEGEVKATICDTFYFLIWIPIQKKRCLSIESTHFVTNGREFVRNCCVSTTTNGYIKKGRKGKG